MGVCATAGAAYNKPMAEATLLREATIPSESVVPATEDERALPTLERLVKKAGNPRIRVYAEEALTRVKADGKKASLK